MKGCSTERFEKIKNGIISYIKDNQPCTFQYGGITPSAIKEKKKIYEYLRTNTPNAIGEMLQKLIAEKIIFRYRCGQNNPYIYSTNPDYKEVENVNLREKFKDIDNAKNRIIDYISDNEPCYLLYSPTTSYSKELLEERERFLKTVGNLSHPIIEKIIKELLSENIIQREKDFKACMGYGSKYIYNIHPEYKKNKEEQPMETKFNINEQMENMLAGIVKDAIKKTEEKMRQGFDSVIAQKNQAIENLKGAIQSGNNEIAEINRQLLHKTKEAEDLQEKYNTLKRLAEEEKKSFVDTIEKLQKELKEKETAGVNSLFSKLSQSVNGMLSEIGYKE